MAARKAVKRKSVAAPKKRPMRSVVVSPKKVLSTFNKAINLVARFISPKEGVGPTVTIKLFFDKFGHNHRFKKPPTQIVPHQLLYTFDSQKRAGQSCIIKI